METDEQIIQQVVEGNQQMFRVLITRYQAKVYAVALKVAKNQRDAEDIAQEVFLQLYRSLGQFKGESGFSTWIYRITMNKAIEYKRRQDRQKAQATDDGFTSIPDSSMLTPEEALMKNAEKEMVHAHLSELPASYRDVVQLYYFEELSYGEIASNLNVAVKTVESRLYRARRLLKSKHEGGAT
ncbi:sigma-70 family RNA polymerase sigma factor [Bacillus sp. 165]|uniref:RNA polymerase sigma factor n=1 Tax=Bacillus sp. 165 TaxID=1529117 RepID=UPI001AD97C60|nr:sigma-70 family RNA polymerase sigma factor [Bacillus sp. 165]